MKVNSFLISTDISNLGSLNSLILNVYGPNTQQREEKLWKRTESLAWKIWRILGTEVFLELIPSSKRTDISLPMIKGGELEMNSRHTKYSNKIISGGLKQDMMVNFGRSTIIEPI